MWVMVGVLLVVASASWMLAQRMKSAAHSASVAGTQLDAPPGFGGGTVVLEKWLPGEVPAMEFTGRKARTFAFRIERGADEYRFVSVESGKRLSPGSLALARVSILYLNVRGWKNHGAARMKAGDRIDLRRESEGVQVAQVITVARPGAKRIYGYINKRYSHRLVKSLDAGEERVGIVMGRSGNTIAIMPANLAEALGL
ncbi:hypothetical protein D3I60_00205 [Brevibacterium permense]|uniref:hypothetical protein n=1 Tax=Brevibacterium permense TaxID=234834 RepID=UPI0021CF3370|nr:hypothetical protein [Brevibacterium permense]MCU4295517.1 hypothetical protein [Brevibacterium permense]